MANQSNFMSEFEKTKRAMAESRKLMEGGLKEKPKPQQKPESAELDMTDEAMRKRDAEYRRKGWIK